MSLGIGLKLKLGLCLGVRARVMVKDGFCIRISGFG